MDRYNKLTIAARYYLLGAGMYEALDAMEYGREIHPGFRKDGVTPAFMHQLQIFHWARSLDGSLMYPEETYVSIFLHDGPEDVAEVTHKKIRQRYSVLAADAIELLDKNGKVPAVYFGGLAQNPIGSVAKLGDRINNMSTMTGVFTQEKQIRYTTEVEDWFMPMIKTARRLFPQQENIYENGKLILNIQLDLLDALNGKN